MTCYVLFFVDCCIVHGTQQPKITQWANVNMYIVKNSLHLTAKEIIKFRVMAEGKGCNKQPQNSLWNSAKLFFGNAWISSMDDIMMSFILLNIFEGVSSVKILVQEQTREHIMYLVFLFLKKKEQILRKVCSRCRFLNKIWSEFCFFEQRIPISLTFKVGRFDTYLKVPNDDSSNYHTQDVQNIAAKALLPNDRKSPDSSALRTNRNFARHLKYQWMKPITTVKSVLLLCPGTISRALFYC